MKLEDVKFALIALPQSTAPSKRWQSLPGIGVRGPTEVLLKWTMSKSGTFHSSEPQLGWFIDSSLTTELSMHFYVVYIPSTVRSIVYKTKRR